MRVKIKLFAGLKDVIGGDLEERFGSYHRLVKMEGFRFKHPKHRDRAKSPSTT